MKKAILIIIGVLITLNIAIMAWRWVELERAAETFLEPEPAALEVPTSDHVGLSGLPQLLAPKKISYASAKVAIVLDDLGVKASQYLLLMDIPYKLNLAIIPGLKNSHDLVKELTLMNRFELILHIPMEPFAHGEDMASFTQTYPFYIDRTASAASIQAILDASMEQIEGWGFIKGINNHMGSYVTSSPNMMAPIVDWAKSHQLYLLDSLTSRSSVAYEMARRQHIPAYHNEIFLDGVDDQDYIQDRLKKAITRARAEGSVVAICHITHRNTLLVLKEMMPQYAQHGVEFVWLSELK